MPRIPVPDRQNPGSISGDRLVIQAPDITAPARALQGLGKALSGLAEEHKGNQDRIAGYQANLAIERWQTDQSVQYQATVDKSAPDGSDIMPNLEKNLASSYQSVRSTIKDPEMQAKADLIFEQTRGRFLTNGVGAAKQRGQNYAQVTTGESIKTATETGIIKTEAEYQDYYENVVKARIDSVFTDPLERKKAHDLFGGQMAEEYLRRNPGRATPKVTDGRLPIITANQPGRISGGSVEGVNPGLLSRFQATQDAFGKSIPIVSGARDETTNAKAGGAKKSQHLSGNAIDLDVSGLSHDERNKLIETASANGITGIGVYENSLHFDVGGRRSWGPSYKSDSIPGWASASISKHLSGKAGPPQTFEAIWPRLVNQESGGNQGAVSPKGATGIAQVMRATGPEAAQLAGLPWDEQKWKSDAGYNETIGKAYFAKQWQDFGGDPAKALAAYNAGPSATHAAIEKHGDGWLAHMPAETRNYVASIIDIGVGPQRRVAYASPPKPTGGMWESVSDEGWGKAINGARTAYKEGLDLGMEQGQVGRSDIEDAPIDDGDKAMLLRRWDDKNKDAIQLADFAERYQSDGFINPKDATDRKSAGMLLDVVGGAEGVAKGDPEAVRSMFEVYEKTGIVPDNVKGGIDAMLRSGNVAQVTTALSYLDALDNRNHRAFQQEFTGDMETLLSTYRHGLDYASPRAKAEEVMKAVDPGTAEIRKKRRDEGEKAAAQLSMGQIKDTFDPSIIPWNEPDLTIAPNAADEMMSDWRMLYADAFALTGDDGQAKKAAGEQLAKAWGPSVANGGRVMKFPPEITYRNPMVNGSTDWMRESLEADLIKKGYTETVDIVTGGRARRTETVTRPLPHFLVADKRTVAEFQSGKKASYQVWVQDADGMFDIVTAEGQAYDIERYDFDHAFALKAYQPTFDKEQAANRKRQEAFDAEQARQKDEGIPGMGAPVEPEASIMLDPFGTGGN